LKTLNQCINNCSDKEWQKPHNDAPFSQVIFHTLFYTDYYLSPNENEFKSQLFHEQNPGIFRNYEELEYRKPEQLYTKEEIKLYMNYCYNKINEYFDKLDDTALIKECGHRNMKSIELLIYIIRHIQHHSAQLGLRIQQITGKELEWIVQDNCRIQYKLR
jgi:uncharacterized damage-inducible protein DinB